MVAGVCEDGTATFFICRITLIKSHLTLFKTVIDKIYVVYDKVAYIASVEVVVVRIVMMSYACLF